MKPKTVGGRDAIFRAAVEAAVAAAQARNFESLDEASPPRFVAGVAADLGMEDGRAVGIAVAVVASAVRARLLDVSAAGPGRGGGKRLSGLVEGRGRVFAGLE